MINHTKLERHPPNITLPISQTSPSKSKTSKMTSKKVLIIMSDASSFPLYNTGAESKTIQQPSGYFLMELAKPLKRLLEAGYEIAFASPEGKEPTPDPLSLSLAAFAGNFYERKRETDLIERMKRENGFSRPKKFSEISDAELEGYAGVFIPGGHAPLADLGDNAELGRILRHFHERGKPTAAICHGPYAFLSTKYVGDGEFAYKGYKITSWSDAEEKFMETVVFRGEVTKVASSLQEAGAEMVEGLGTALGQVTVDRELVTADNPVGADALGQKFVEMLKA
ncbi:ThiJ/PfpI family protein [Westerdykella ornata]|uniref:D-lactate dehydratase n=1 Tax=Westerdykella ornata TaxID=318751 RepID=A0A6A6JVE2_WESOR|nr:ThiJ/PfpI family protein [Westerdykella ornata]KAF2279716.1 ThiJ/PfpI family protein [Westerdykella ornata]